MTFDQAVSFVLAQEGGWSNDPRDNGGSTRYGISSRAHPEVDLSTLTIEQAKALYLAEYWLPMGCPRLDSAMALIAFDSATQHGVNRAWEWLEQHPTPMAYLAARLRFYTSLEDWDAFGRGWMNRIAALMSAVAKLDADDLQTIVFNNSVLDFLRLIDEANERRVVLRGVFASTRRGPKLDVREA